MVDLGRLRRYQCGVLKNVLIVLLIFTPAGALVAQTGEVSAARPAEYMIYQYPDVAMVVKIDARETEFESRIFGPENALLKASGIPNRRIGPMYQFIDAVDKPRQLMVKVSPGQRIDRSKINMELIQLPEHDRSSAAFAQAYKLFSYAVELVHTNDSTTWATKAYTLKNSARAFSALGWEEMRLWSEYYAAHLVLFKLSDELTAMELAQEIQRSARRAGFDDIEMAALLLQSDALMKAGYSTTGQVSKARFEQAHGVLNQLVILAGQLGFKSEQSRALFNNGLAWEQQGDLEKAIEQFQRALEVSVSAGDSELSNEIRSTAAVAYETLGRTSGAIEMLDNIGSELSSDSDQDAGQELATNLFEKGRLLNSNYRYLEASYELSQALELQQAKASQRPWGPTALELAWSYYSMGEMDQAASLIQEGIPRTPVSSNGRELMRAYGSLARIYRDSGQYGRMTQYREKQEDLIDSESQRAAYSFESALDAGQEDGPGTTGEGRWLARSKSQAVKSGDTLAQHRATLYLCLNYHESDGAKRCTAGEVSQAHKALRNSGIPRLALEADFVRSRILRLQGRLREALNAMDRLAGELLFIRQSLPGVLGAWYWENRTEIFSEYMSITIALAGTSSPNDPDGRLSLLTLDRIRSIESMDRTNTGAFHPQDNRSENLRGLLARCEASGNQADNALVAEVNLELADLRKQFVPPINAVDPSALDEYLGSLSSQEVVLSYYFDKRNVYALAGMRSGVRLIRIPGADQIVSGLHNAREPAGQGDPSLLPALETLGSLLVKPVARFLKKRIYLQSTGPLNGFPFDVLRFNGQFVAANHQVVNLVSLAGIGNRNALVKAGFGDRVFLAGNPQSGQKLFSYDVPVSAEINAVTDIFVGPGLHIVQGVALRKDEFTDQRFTGADLIHLATPGTLDPAFPDRSRLKLSSDTGDPESEYLNPTDIRELDFRASLVVLSGTAVVGGNKTPFDSGLGFVSDFLAAGANAVVVTIWPAGDTQTTRFVTDFYRNLESNGDVVEALSKTRNSRIENRDMANFRTWAGFQLYIR